MNNAGRLIVAALKEAVLIIAVSAVVSLAVIALTSCAGNRPPSGEPTPKPTAGGEVLDVVALVARLCPAAFDPTGLLDTCSRPGTNLLVCVIQHCPAPPPPPVATQTAAPPTAAPSTASPSPAPPAATQTSAPAPTASAVPTQAQTSAPSTPTLVPIGGSCTKGHASFAVQVRAAQLQAEADHPSWLRAPGERTLPHQGDWTPYAQAVASNLRAAGLDAAVDACNCAVIAVTAHGELRFHDDYAVLVSSGDVRDPFTGGYIDTCVPRGFPLLQEQPGPTSSPAPAPPTAAPSPDPTVGPVAAATPESCPPLVRIGLSTKGAPFPMSGTVDQAGQWIDHTGRFLCADPNGCPCNAEHHKVCSSNGDDHSETYRQCEPVARAVRTTLGAGVTGVWSTPHNPADTPHVYRGYEVAIVGKKGTHWHVTSTVMPGAMGKDGKPVKLAPGFKDTPLEGEF